MPVKYKYRQISLKDAFLDCQDMFEQMVDHTEPICQMINSEPAQILTFDTSGIELYVNENNSKTLNALISQRAFLCPTSGFICQSGLTAGI